MSWDAILGDTAAAAGETGSLGSKRLTSRFGHGAPDTCREPVPQEVRL